MIFDRLSIFSRLGPLQLLRKVAALPGADCLLCAAASGNALVCSCCEADLAPLRAACPRCALPMPAAQTCGRCLRHPPSFAHAHATFEYRFPLDRVVQRFKFAGDLAAGRWLAEQLALTVHDADRPGLLVVPALAPARLRVRGFNQALEIARVVGREKRIRVEARALARLRETTPQPPAAAPAAA